MKGQNFRKTKALVLKRTNYGDNDKIVTFLTPAGKIDCIIKGIRKETSKMLLASQPFVLLDLTYLEQGRELKIITNVSVVEQYTFDDLEQINIAYGVLSFSLLLTENSEQIDLFNLISQAFKSLTHSQISHSPKLVAVWYIVHILHNLGQLPDMRNDVEGQTMTEDNDYYYDAAKHGFSVSTDENSRNDTVILKVIRYYLANESILSSRSLKIDPILQEKTVGLVQRLASEALEQDISRLFSGAV